MAVMRSAYDSGQDYRLEYGDLVLSFNELDFLERAELAARELNLVARELDDQEREDLAEFICHALPPCPPRSDFGEHLKAHWAQVLLASPRPVHWLRRLMFRGAWLDQRVKEGELEARFAHGRFEYWDPRRGERIDLAPCPDFSDIRYG